jgi:hypothetical protein
MNRTITHDTPPDPRLEPLYAATVASQPWSPGDLRKPYDLEDVIARSYEKVMVRMHLRHQIERRSRAKKARRPRPTRHLP